MDTTSGTLDEALLRLHTSGPEFRGYLSNHGPMAVEAMVHNGQAHTVHRWLDGYTNKLESVPSARARITGANWREALGDSSRVTDWTAYFTHQVAERPWRELLAEWWPRLLPGIAGAATHPVIRVGHAVRSLLTEGEDAARTAEFAHALGYWAARHLLLPASVRPTGSATPSEALATLPRVADQHVTPVRGYAQLPDTQNWLRTTESLHVPDDPEAVREGLTALVRAATLNYADYGHGNGIMLVHAATAPNAVLRTLPALPRELWAGSFAVAWAATSAVTAIYAADAPLPAPHADAVTPEEVFERAVAHGNEHAIKFADTALDVAAASEEGDTRALSAALNALALIDEDD
ncbi:questin oxidase family protein [Streptomyces sp. DSM 41527]|uniref:Questin oxidase family protein n=1 Tax=Streptomyces mooreae TaxID=3075523 RepID=A0ABU2TAZ5_9ACTN|nr:questin oxidase family protein [Streptomyces sp. DSM 41527]MDT0458096.1 questin oxidase family protein [Streptomyces sp. DSM 41527]